MQRVRWLKCIARVPRRLRWRCWRWTARIQLVFIFFSFQIVQRRHGQRSRLGTRAPHLSPGRDLWLGVYATCAMAQAHTNVVARVPRRLRRPCRRSRLVMLTMLNVSGPATTRPSKTPSDSRYALEPPHTLHRHPATDAARGSSAWLESQGVVIAIDVSALDRSHSAKLLNCLKITKTECERSSANTAIADILGLELRT